MKTLTTLFLLFILTALSSAYDVGVSEDWTGDGYIQTMSQSPVGYDRASGTGEWAYGHQVSPEDLMSLFNFEGRGGSYTIAHTNGNFTQLFQATDLSAFNVSSIVDDNTTSIQASGNGRIKSVVLGIGTKSHPVDLSRTYTSGNINVNSSVSAW